MSRAFLRTVLLLAAVGAFLAVPSIASAASATLSSPPDGATYYAGDTFPWRAQVPTSASFDRTGCTMGTMVGGIERSTGTSPSGAFASEGGTSAGSFTKTAVLEPGDYEFRAWLDCGGGSYIYSGVRTIHVKSGNAPPPGPDPSELEAACAAFRESLGKFGRLVQRENDAVPVIEYTERFAQRSGWATGAVERAAPPPLKPAFKLVASIYGSEYNLAKYIQFLHEQDHKSHVIQLGALNASYNDTCKGVKAAALSSFAAWPALPVTTVTAANAPRLGRLRRAAKNESKTFKKLKAAMRALHSHRTDSGGAPAGDVAAVRAQAAKAIKLIRQHRRLVKALVRDRAVSRVRLRARDLTGRRRRDRYVRGLVNKPASKVLVNKTTAKAESRLITVLKQEPLLP